MLTGACQEEKRNRIWMNWIRNLSLKKKFILIICLLSLLMTVSACIAFGIIDRSYQNMLSTTLTDSLSYASEGIVDYMEDMEGLSMMMLSDAELQAALVSIQKGEKGSLAEMNAIQELRSAVGLYYQLYADGILDYITLYTDASNAYTNILKADQVPMDIQTEMVTRADRENGKPCWITAYMKDYGFFLGRRINSVQSYRLERLGTIVLKIDMDALVNHVTKQNEQYDETSYVICSGSDILYHTNTLTDEAAVQVEQEMITDYKTVKLGEHEYFVVHGNMSTYGWDYYCLVSFDAMSRRFTQARLLCAGILVPAVLGALLVSGYLIGGIMKHVDRLTDKMRQFAADNTIMPSTDYDYSRREDELGVLHRQFDQMSRTIIRLIQENYVKELVNKETQLKALENQINPHFLYNTLESVRWRAKAVGENRIADMVESLGILLRSTLNCRDMGVYSLGKEMEVISAYITIQKYRYEERLIFESDISPLYYGISIPKFSLQPLIENAVYYGVESNVDGIEIELSLRIRDGKLHFLVRNTGSEMEEDLLEKLKTCEIKPRGHGIGLQNIDKRVKMQYGQSYGLRLYNEEEFAVAELVIPVENEREKHAETDSGR